MLDRGRGFGPWTAQISFKFEEGVIRDLRVPVVSPFEDDGASSR